MAKGSVTSTAILYNNLTPGAFSTHEEGYVVPELLVDTYTVTLLRGSHYYSVPPIQAEFRGFHRYFPHTQGYGFLAPMISCTYCTGGMGPWLPRVLLILQGMDGA
jgi:hypothetical protein